MIDKLFIIIVFYNPSDEQKKKALELAEFCNVIVIDNSIELNAFISSKELKTSFIYISLGENKGIAYAQNVGIKVAKEHLGTFVLLLDQDSTITLYCITRLLSDYIKAKSMYPNLVALGPLVCDNSTDILYKTYKNRDLHNIYVVPTIISSGTLMEILSFEKIGLMEEKLFIDYVDHEWCWRAFSNGYVCCIDINVKMLHKVGNKTVLFCKLPFLVSSPFRYFYQYRNSLWLIRRNYVPFNWKIKTLIKNFIGFFLLPWYSSSPFGVMKSMLKGLFAGLKK